MLLNFRKVGSQESKWKTIQPRKEQKTVNYVNLLIFNDKDWHFYLPKIGLKNQQSNPASFFANDWPLKFSTLHDQPKHSPHFFVGGKNKSQSKTCHDTSRLCLFIQKNLPESSKSSARAGGFSPPIWKDMQPSNWIIFFPGIGVKITELLKPPPRPQASAQPNVEGF